MRRTDSGSTGRRSSSSPSEVLFGKGPPPHGPPVRRCRYSELSRPRALPHPSTMTAAVRCRSVKTGTEQRQSRVADPPFSGPISVARHDWQPGPRVSTPERAVPTLASTNTRVGRSRCIFYVLFGVGSSSQGGRWAKLPFTILNNTTDHVEHGAQERTRDIHMRNMRCNTNAQERLNGEFADRFRSARGMNRGYSPTFRVTIYRVA